MTRRNGLSSLTNVRVNNIPSDSILGENGTNQVKKMVFDSKIVTEICGFFGSSLINLQSTDSEIYRHVSAGRTDNRAELDKDEKRTALKIVSNLKKI